MTVAVSEVEAVLGRAERPLPTVSARVALRRERILITGAAGSIGQALGLDEAVLTDLDTLDITREDSVFAISELKPTLILHLAGVKYAPQAEEDPSECVRVNAQGTERVVKAAKIVGARVVTASTCKAIRPETCYGATKLLAERITLNAGGTVARFFNVVESQGNVFELWRDLPEDAPVRYTDCERFFMSRAEAVSLLLNAAVLPPGRYAFDARPARRMEDVAADLYPDRDRKRMAARRGDRLVEPFVGDREFWQYVGIESPLIRIRHPHD